MAAAPANNKLLAVAAAAGFMAGCWVGIGSEHTGEVYCVVTATSAAGRPGLAPGQLVERTSPATGCQPGEPVVCGRYEGAAADERRFVSDQCPDDVED